MNLITLIFRKKEFVFTMFFAFAFIQMSCAQSPDLFIYIVAQQDNEIGSPKDKETMKALAEEIKQNVPGLNVHVELINSARATKATIQEKLRSTTIDNNDIVWYYYSGHGKNYDTFPKSAEGDVPLTWVHQQLKQTPARLSIAMYDCCSWLAPEASLPSDIQPKSATYKFLFLEAKGNIISASCSSRQFSYGNPNSGGIFTNSFIDALRTKATWKEVLVESKKTTKQNAQVQGRTQVPTYDIQVTTTIPEPAPVLKTKWFSSLDEMAKEMTASLKASNINKKVTIKDIIRWNEDKKVTESNFKDFEELEFKMDDPELEDI